MSTFSIHAKIDDSDILESMKEPVNSLTFSGELYISINGKSYPNASWEDFVIPVITWWLEDMKNLLIDKSVLCEFMDDAYKIQLRFVEEQEVILVSFFHGGFEEYLVKDTPVKISLYVGELIKIAKSLVEQINEVVSGDINCLDYKSLTENLYSLEQAWSEFCRIHS